MAYKGCSCSCAPESGTSMATDNLHSPLPAAQILSTYVIILFSKDRFNKEARSVEGYVTPRHFKRLVTDEVHGFGNVTAGTTDATILIGFLHLDAR
ncbi:hypothetical protein DSL72_006869 [Monilinia vaccinii-corymbosi]|uniref:Uncharacterized protein n=1 Tax=Monilinia vaccinii-corymbosi TaxID=61207 RepID=A0A8A3PK18_9HELO|nr:hypothetical protein DSL72_006869 [Monilinia vaccinii-corymbosi]